MLSEPWATWYNVQIEFRRLRRLGHEVRQVRPKRSKKTYDPVRVHLHDATTKEIVHLYSGPFDQDSLNELMRDLARIYERYMMGRYRNSLCESIRLIVVEDPANGDTLPNWFLPAVQAAFPGVIQ